MNIVINLDKYQLEHCKRHVKEGYSNLIEEAVVKGDLLDDVLNRIMVKIKKLDGKYIVGDYATYGENSPKYVPLSEILQIIDKYKEGDSEEV